MFEVGRLVTVPTRVVTEGEPVQTNATQRGLEGAGKCWQTLKDGCGRMAGTLCRGGIGAGEIHGSRVWRAGLTGM